MIFICGKCPQSPIYESKNQNSKVLIISDILTKIWFAVLPQVVEW
jgi:hypothetical protein